MLARWDVKRLYYNTSCVPARYMIEGMYERTPQARTRATILWQDNRFSLFSCLN
jgi:hypothetical protein